MSVQAGAKAFRDGLVFQFDMENTKKSWKGAPLTNYYPDLFTSTSMRTHTKHYWTGTRWIEDSTYSHPGVPGPYGVFLGKVAKHVSGAFNSTWSGNSYGYMLRDISSQVSSNFYSQSCWVYISEDCNIAACPSVIEQELGGESSVSSGQAAAYDLNSKGTWQRIAKRAQSDGTVRYIPVYPRVDGTTTGVMTGFMMWGGVQVEDGSYVSRLSPADDGITTRSNTQAVIDISGNNNTITANSLTYNTDDTVSYNGTSDYMSAGAITNLDDSTSISFEAWVKVGDLATTDRKIICYKRDANTDANFQLRRGYNTDGLYYQWHNSAWQTFSIDNFFSNTTDWHHVAIVHDPSATPQVVCYKNGEQFTTYTGNTTPLDWQAASMLIGYRTAAEYFYGRIGAVKIWNRTLSADEILDSFNASRGSYGI